MRAAAFFNEGAKIMMAGLGDFRYTGKEQKFLKNIFVPYWQEAWENGTSDPSTTNLMAIAKLFGVSTEELLKEVR